MEPIWNEITGVVGPYLPRLLAALGILIVGWIAALAIAAAVRGILKRTTLDNRVARWIAGAKPGEPIDVEGGIAKLVYYIALLLVLVAFFQILGLTLVTEPLVNLLGGVFVYIPRLLAAAVLLLIAWVIATAVKLAITRGLGVLNLDERLGKQADLHADESDSISKTIAEVTYWLILLLFLPAVFSALALEGLLQPIQEMSSEFVNFLPNLFAAVLTLAVGWLGARILQRVVTKLLAAAGIDRLSDHVGLSSALGEQRLSTVVGLVLYVLVLIPIAIAALTALELPAVVAPVSNMLEVILAALPVLFGAALVLTFAYIAGRIVAAAVNNVLANIGFNRLLERWGVATSASEEGTTPASVVGSIVLYTIMIFALAEAADLLGFTTLSELAGQFLLLAGHIALGLVILGIGFYLADLAARAIRATGKPQAGLLATAARIGVLVFVTAVALQQMGLANEIINLAFGLTLGAIAVALAIAFGLGGREIAAQQLSQWAETVRSRGRQP